MTINIGFLVFLVSSGFMMYCLIGWRISEMLNTNAHRYGILFLILWAGGLFGLVAELTVMIGAFDPRA